MTVASVLCIALTLLAQPDPKKTRVYKQAAEMDYGPCIAATVGVSKENITPKGLVICVDREKQAYVLFDTELLRVSAAWTGGWLQLAGRAYADDSNDYPWMGGSLVFQTPVGPGWARDGAVEDPRPVPRDGPLPRDWAKFRGLYVHGEKIVLSYTVGPFPVLELHGVEKRGETIGFTRTLEMGPTDRSLTLVLTEGALVHNAPSGSRTEPRDGRLLVHLPPLKDRSTFTVVQGSGDRTGLQNASPSELIHGGPARWKEPVVTTGTLGKEAGPYVVDTLTAPEANPWKSWLRFTGLDFFPDGRAAVCTWSGDVWVVSGIDPTLEKLSWKRFAAGIGQPMGLKIVDGKIHTVARDQITRLHDLNGDGEADYYECVNNDIKLTTNFHEFCFDLQTDKDGNFYCTKGSSIWAGSQRMTDHHGTVCKISKDGTTLEIVATGLRAPNGLGISPTGDILCTDNQGNWIPECPINLIKPGGHYGFAGHGQKPREADKPIAWIPMSVDRSSGGICWVPDGRWGPLQGQPILSSYDCSISLVLIEKLQNGAQGGVVRFPFRFPSGVMRGRFNAVDGQLYLAGLRGWSSGAAKDCILQRVRHTGKPVHLPVKVAVRKGGMDVTFSDALDAASVADPENIGAVAFNVVRTGNYGSAEYSIEDPKKHRRDPVEIKSAALKEDGRTIALEIPGLKPVTNLVVKFRLKGADGTSVALELDYTLHAVPGE